MILDRFQQQAIDHIKKGFSVLVSAPTGAGKTVIAEHIINDCLDNDRRAVYTAPIKALSNQKFRDFQKIYENMVGILTGDVSINPSAPVLIMTTEIFRNKVLSEPLSLAEYSWVIFDEIHYLDNYERGTVWEESLILLPPHMRLLGLSATIPNIDQFAAWIRSITGHPLKVVIEDERPVPLSFLYQYSGKITDSIKTLRLGSRRHSSYYHGRRQKPEKPYAKPNKLAPLIDTLQKTDRLPCIYFVFSRRRCEYLAEEISGFDFLQMSEKGDIILLYDQLCEKFGLTGEKTSEILRSLIKKGIAYHHAGMLPTLKEVVERLFTSRLIKVIFTTETFALGINMPARTVVFDELRKYYGRGFSNLKTRDFYQMAGRAGRRGIDPKGFVYSRVKASSLTFPELKRMIYGAPEEVVSRFNASYATILNLYERYAEDLHKIYPLSFHCFQAQNRARQKAVSDITNKLSLLKSLDYIRTGILSEKGVFASNIYGYELPVSELYYQETLDAFSCEELGLLFAALVFEPRKNAITPKLNKTAKRLRRITSSITSFIHKKEKQFGLREKSKEYYYHLSPVVDAWMKNAPFETISQLTDIDEGEIIRNLRMALQVMRELLDTPASGSLKKKLYKTIDTINRDVIDAEKQLREV